MSFAWKDEHMETFFGDVSKSWVSLEQQVWELS